MSARERSVLARRANPSHRDMRVRAILDDLGRARMGYRDGRPRGLSRRMKRLAFRHRRPS